MKILPSGYFNRSCIFGRTAYGFLLTGGGYGHGVGMSQNGARHLLAKMEQDGRKFFRYFTKIFLWKGENRASVGKNLQERENNSMMIKKYFQEGK